MQNPLDYNPASIFGINKNYDQTEIKLLVKERYCDIDFNKNVAYFYLMLTDKTNDYLLPCKYYEFLAASNVDYVFCKYIKLQQGNTTLNVLELSKMPKVHLSIEDYDVDSKVIPIANANNTIPKEYVKLSKEFLQITKVLNKQSDFLYVGLATVTLQNGVYVSALCSTDNLFNFMDTGIQYRKLIIDDKEILVDMEVFSI